MIFWQIQTLLSIIFYIQGDIADMAIYIYKTRILVDFIFNYMIERCHLTVWHFINFSSAFLVKDAYQKVPVRPLPVTPKIVQVENKLDPCPWTWLEYLGLTSFILVIVGVLAGIIGCCFCCRGTGGTSNI